MLKNCQVLCKTADGGCMRCHGALNVTELRILPCKHFKNVRAGKDGTAVSPAHPFLGCQPLSLKTMAM